MSTSGQVDPEMQSESRSRADCNQKGRWDAGFFDNSSYRPDFKLMVVDLKLTADSVKPSAPRELFRLPAVDTGISPYDTTPDGRRC